MGGCQSRSEELIAEPYRVKCAISQQEEYTGVKAQINDVLTQNECKFILEECGKLSPDPSNDNFVPRTKKFAFIQLLENKLIRSEQDWFIQNDQYNDFNGGYKRQFELIPMEVIKSAAFEKAIRHWQKFWNIPNGEWTFIHIQNNEFDLTTEGKCPTGQGIHSDGANHGGIVVLTRENIVGATNSIYNDLEGKDAVLGPVEVQPGQILLWKDNKVFHEVAPAGLEPNKTNGSRAVIVILDCGEMFMTGTANLQNQLGKNEFPNELKLRNKEQYNVELRQVVDQNVAQLFKDKLAGIKAAQVNNTEANLSDISSIEEL